MATQAEKDQSIADWNDILSKANTGKGHAKAIVPDPTPAPTIINATATPSSLPVGGGNVTIDATVANATSVTLDGAPVTLPVVVPVTASHTFALVAHGVTAPDASVNLPVAVALPIPDPAPGPTAIASIPAGEARVITTNRMHDVWEGAQPAGGGTDIKGVHAWCSGVYAPLLGANGSLINFSGGDADSWDTAVRALDVASGAWARVKNRCTALTWDFTNDPQFDVAHCEHGDGTPAVPHTYDLVCYLPPEAGGGPKGSLLLVASRYAYTQRTTNWPHRLDLATMQWSRLAAQCALPLEAIGMCEYDPTTKRVWILPAGPASAGWVDGLTYLDFSDGSGRPASVAFAAQQLVFGGVMRFWSGIDGARRYLVATTYSDAGARLCLIDLDNIVAGIHTLTLSQPTPFFAGFTFLGNGRAFGMASEPANDGGRIYDMVPPADPINGVWQVTPRPMTGLTLPAASGNVGLYKRLHGHDDLGVVTCYIDADGPVFAYRPPAIDAPVPVPAPTPTPTPTGQSVTFGGSVWTFGAQRAGGVDREALRDGVSTGYGSSYAIVSGALQLTVLDGGGSTWQWDGSAWQRVGVVAQTTTPAPTTTIPSTTVPAPAALPGSRTLSCIAVPYTGVGVVLGASKNLDFAEVNGRWYKCAGDHQALDANGPDFQDGQQVFMSLSLAANDWRQETPYYLRSGMNLGDVQIALPDDGACVARNNEIWSFTSDRVSQMNTADATTWARTNYGADIVTQEMEHLGAWSVDTKTWRVGGPRTPEMMGDRLWKVIWDDVLDQFVGATFSQIIVWDKDGNVLHVQSFFDDNCDFHGPGIVKLGREAFIYDQMHGTLYSFSLDAFPFVLTPVLNLGEKYGTLPGQAGRTLYITQHDALRAVVISTSGTRKFHVFEVDSGKLTSLDRQDGFVNNLGHYVFPSAMFYDPATQDIVSVGTMDWDNEGVRCPNYWRTSIK